MAAARSKRPGNHRAKASSQPATGKSDSRTERDILVSARRRGRVADRIDGAARPVAAPELPLRAVRHGWPWQPGGATRRRRRRGVAERAAVREDRDVLAGVLRGLRHRGRRRVRAHPRRRHAAGCHQVQHPDRPCQVQEHLVGVRHRAEGAGRPGLLPGLGADLPRVQRAGRVQVRPVRGVQEAVQRHGRPGVRRQVQDPRLPRRLRHRRGRRRRRALPHGGRQGQGADAARLRQGAARRLPQDRQVRRLCRAVQRNGSSLGATDSIHHDEVRDVREHRGDGVQAPHPHPEGPDKQAGSARRELRERLRRRSLLRRHLAPCRQPRLLSQQRQRRHRCRCCQEPWRLGPLHAGPSASHPHDRHPDRYSVGDLRCIQSHGWIPDNRWSSCSRAKGRTGRRTSLCLILWIFERENILLLSVLSNI